MASNSDRPDEDEAVSSSDSPASAFTEVGKRISEIRDYAAYYVAAQLDRVKLSIRNVFFYIALGILGVVVGGAMAVMAIVLICLGFAGLLSRLFGHVWLGNLVSGAAILGALIVAAYVGLSYATRTSRERMVNAYEQRKRRQRDDHGVDVHERAEV